MNTLRPRVIASTFSSAFWVCALCVLASVFIGATSQGATVGFRFLNNTGGADTNTFRVVPIDTVLSDGSVITKGIPIRLTPNASGYAQTNLMVGDYFVTNAVLARGYTIRVPNDLGVTIYCGTCSTEDASTNLAISGLNRFITIRSTNAPATSAGITNALGFLPLTPTQTTNAALGAALNATNGFGTIVRSNYTDYILTNALPGLTNGHVTASVTNGLAGTNFAKAVTNGFGTIVFSNATAFIATNALPALTNGFVVATVTNGLSSTGYVVTAINAATNQMATRAYVTSATNALGSAAFRSVTAFQPSSTTLSNLATTGAYTNIPVPGNNVTFSTNSNGQVTISASTNGSGGVSVAAATRTTAATNGVVVSISAVSQTNNFTDLVYSNASLFYPRANISNYATATDLTNRTIEVTNGFGTIVRSNATVYVHTNALVTLTNKFATTNYSGAINLTNNANRFGNITAANITNLGTFTTAGNISVTAGELTVNGQVTAQTYVGNAGDLTNYNANQLADGPIPLNVISGLVASNIDATTWSLATNLNGGNAVTATNVTSFITNRWRADITSSNLTLVTSNDTRAFNWTNTASIYAGIVTNGNISTTNFLIGPNRIYLRTTNSVASRGSGTAGAWGTFYWDSTLKVYTNELSGYYITNIASIWYMETAASVIQYSSSGLETNAWTQVNGSSTVPNSSYGDFFDTSGTVFIGPILSTNLTFQITNYFGNTLTNNFVRLVGGDMTGAITNNLGYYGNAVGLTNIGNVVNSNQALVVASGPGLGGVRNSSTPDLLTSAANIIDMPPRGNEIWANQKKPMVIISSRMGPFGIGSSNNLQNCTENNMVLALKSFQTNGLLGFTTNLGIRVAYQAENGWLTNHRDASNLEKWNTNRWFSATVNPTNVTRIARTNNVEFWLMQYADTVNPTNGNTECDLNPISGANNYWHYPNGVNNLGAVEIQPLITGDSVPKDIATFYAWGVSGLTIQDGGDYYQFMGYQDGVQRKLAYSALHPYYEVWDATSPVFIQGNFQSWQNLDGVFPFRPNQHGMILNYLISTPTYYWPGEVEYNANGVCFGSGGQSTEPSGSGVLGQTASNIRPQIRFYTNLLSGTIHPIWQSDNLTDMQLWGPTDWKNHLALIAMFNSDLELTAPQQSYFSNAAFSVNYTNICTNGIWMDDAQNRVIVISLGVTNGIFAKRLVDPNKVAVAMFNMGTQGATNLTVQFSAFGWETNAYAVAIDNFTNSNRGQFSNSMTLSVGSTNVEWVTLEKKQSFSSVNPYAVTNNTPGLVGASAIMTLGINTNQVTISSEGVGIGTGLSGLALFEIHTQTGSYKTNALNIDDQYIFYRSRGDGLFYLNGQQSGANGFVLNGVNGEYARFLPAAVSTVSNLAINNPTFLKTNAAPSNVTIGTTAPDRWILVTNNALAYYMPVWTNH